MVTTFWVLLWVGVVVYLFWYFGDLLAVDGPLSAGLVGCYGCALWWFVLSC